MASFAEALPGLQAQGYANIMDALAAYNRGQQESFFTPSPTPAPGPIPTETPPLSAPSSFVDYGPPEPSYVAPTPAPAPAPAPEPAGGLQYFTNLAAPEPTPDYRSMAQKAYTNILNRPGDVGGLDYWTSQLASGKISPENFEAEFRKVAAPELGVQQLYTDILKRPYDIGGLEHWVKEFGAEISPEERAKFIQFAEPELKARGLTAPAPVPAPAPAPAPAPSTTAPKVYEVGSLGTIKSAEGKDYDAATLINLYQQIIPNLGELSGSAFGEQGATMGFAYGELKRLFEKDPSAAQQVIFDIARNLVDKGITNLDQIKVKDIRGEYQLEPVYDGGPNIKGYMVSYTTPGLEEAGPQKRYLTPEEAQDIEWRKISTTDEGYPVEREVPFGKNIRTAQELYFGENKLSPSAFNWESSFNATPAYNIGETYAGPGMTGYRVVIDPKTGKPVFTTYGSRTGEADLVSAALTMASFIPGAAPVVQFINAAHAIDQGDYLGAAASIAGMGGYGDAATAFRAANAIKNGDALQLAAAIMSNPNASKGVGDFKLAGDVTLRDAGNAANLLNAVSKGDWSGAITAAGLISGSKDLQTAGTAARVIDAINRGDFAGAANATRMLGNAISAAEKLNDKNTVTSLTEEAAKVEKAEAGEQNLWESTYKSAINSGATKEDAITAANSVAGVIQYPGGEDTSKIEDIKLAAADTGTTTDVLPGIGRLSDVVVTARRLTGEEGEEQEPISLSEIITAVEEGAPSLTQALSKTRALFSFGTAEPVPQNAIYGALFGTGGVSGTGEEDPGFRLFVFDNPVKKQEALNSFRMVFEDPQATQADKFFAQNAINKIEQMPVSQGQTTSTSTEGAVSQEGTVSQKGETGGGTTMPVDNLRALVDSGLARENADNTFTITHDDGSTETFDVNGKQIAFTTATDVMRSTEPKWSVPSTTTTPIKTADVAPTVGTKGGVETLPLDLLVSGLGKMEEPGTVGPFQTKSTAETLPIKLTTPGAGTTEVPGTMGPFQTPGTTGATGAGTGTTSTEGPGAGVTGVTGPGGGGPTGDIGPGGGGPTGNIGPVGGGPTGDIGPVGGGPTGPVVTPTGPTAPPTGPTAQPTGPITPPPPSTPRRTTATPALAAMLGAGASEFIKPRELPITPDVKLFTALEEITGGLTTNLSPTQLASVETTFFDYLDEKEKERERQKEEEELNKYYYDVDVQQAKEGGLIDHKPEFYSEGGASVMANRYVKGRGDGTSDSVPAMLASGEFVIPADVVSSLGNGDNDAGAKTLDKFMEVIRIHKRSAPPNKLPEDSKGPLAYLEEALTKARKKK